MRRNRQSVRRTGTVNRGWLKRQILKGNVEAKRLSRYTDDYLWDVATDFGRTDWLPAVVISEEERKFGYTPDGRFKFEEGDFRGFGRAWWNDDGTITLSFGWESYELRLGEVEKGDDNA
jgi:hypothetical protein